LNRHHLIFIMIIILFNIKIKLHNKMIYIIYIFNLLFINFFFILKRKINKFFFFLLF